MKKIFGVYLSRQKPVAYGVTDAEYVKLHAAIVEEFEAAKSRQKNPDGAPTQYMRGLQFAMAAIEAIPVHAMEVL